MVLFDTHAHLTSDDFADRDQIILDLQANNVGYVLTCGCDIEDSKNAQALAAKYPNIYCAVGVHAHEAQKAAKDYLSTLTALAKMPKVVAIGEIGLDYHYDFCPKELQKELFIQQLQLATKLKLPVILHDREAHKDMLDCLLPFKGNLTGVMHCYSGSAEMVNTYLDLGLMIGIGGSVTFKTAEKTKRAAQAVPLKSMLLETDCPYLSPVPLRGKRNEPKNTLLVCNYLAELLGISPQEIATATTQNALKLFKI